jgi:hypothetical protein
MKNKNIFIKIGFWIMAVPIFIISLFSGPPEDTFLLIKDTCKEEEPMSIEEINKII